MHGLYSSNVQAFMDEYYSVSQSNPIAQGRLFVYSPEEFAMVELSPFDNMIHIGSIFAVPKGKGFGRAALQDICELADKHRVALHLAPVPFGRKGEGLKKRDLVAWYKRYGFKTDKRYPSDLIREPSGGDSGSRKWNPKIRVLD